MSEYQKSRYLKKSKNIISYPNTKSHIFRTPPDGRFPKDLTYAPADSLTKRRALGAEDWGMGNALEVDDTVST